MAILRVGIGEERDVRLARCEALATNGGFAPSRRLHTPLATVTMTPALGQETCHLFQCSDGFCAVVGVIFVDGCYGEKAAEALWHAFDGKPHQSPTCRGHFAAALFKDQTLWLVTDELGAYKFYRDEGRSVLSTSFLDAFIQGSPTPDPFGLYQYAIQGTCIGTRTFCSAVSTLVGDEDFAGGHVVFRPLTSPREDPRPTTDEGWIDIAEERLSALFSQYSKTRARPVDLAITGGFDSRLLVGLSARAGLDYELFVYGSQHDKDVQIARQVAEAKGKHLRFVDKNLWEFPDHSTYQSLFKTQFIAYDGWANGPVLNTGHDHDERLTRARHNSAVINGGLGEVLRNFFSLPDRSVSLDHLVTLFLKEEDPLAVTNVYRQIRFREQFAEEIGQALGHPGNLLDRSTVERAYTEVRGKWWTSRELSISMRYSEHLFPFLERSVFEGFEHAPVALKSAGRLQSALLTRIAPDLSDIPLAYGFTPQEGPSTKHQLKSVLAQNIPVPMRRRLYHRRLRAGGRAGVRQAMRNSAAVVDPSLPKMSAFFDVDQLADTDTYLRLAGLEYLFTEF